MKSSNVNGVDVDRSAVNRENAQHSTGPRTEPGKQRSKLNALRHALTGQTIVLPTDDLSAYQAFTRRFFDDLRPKGALEEQLVQTLADCSWRLNRARAIETNLLALGIADERNITATGHPEADAALAMARAFCDQAKALANLSMLEQRLSRQFEKALKQLRELQHERRNREASDLDQAAEILQMHKEQKLPYRPAEDGFVFSNAEIENYIQREERISKARRAYWARPAAG